MTTHGKIVAGFSLALTIVLTIGCSYAMAFVVTLRTHPTWAAGGLATVGLIFVICDRLRERSHEPSGPISLTANPVPEEHPLQFLKRTGYWGCILCISAVPTYFLMEKQNRPMPVMARTLPEANKPVVVDTPKPKPAPVVTTKFPQLNLRGLICNGLSSTAVINGQTIRLGEKIEGVKVVAIERWGITVESDGRQKHLTLPRQ